MLKWQAQLDIMTRALIEARSFGDSALFHHPSFRARSGTGVKAGKREIG